MTAFEFLCYCVGALVLCMCLPYLLAIAVAVLSVAAAFGYMIVSVLLWPFEKYRLYNRRKRGQYM